MYRIGIDVGGTFTDLVAIDPAGVTTLAKVPSTPEDPSLGVLDGLAQLAEAWVSTAPRCLARPTASFTAPPLRPTPSSSTKAPEQAC
jgi:N-methylhydantoinase A/oxoprolinase/acetone carboxylase beta subunit